MGLFFWGQMRLIDRIANRLGYAKKTSRRAYAAAAVNRLTASWTISNRTGDEELKTALRPLRARSRELVQNNDHARKFMKMVSANVIGAAGITLQSKVKQPDGGLDIGANSIIEEAWARWGSKGTPTVCGQYSWADVQRVAVESVARDGEILIRKDRTFPNGFGFALQLIEADHLDENYNRELKGGGRITMGVEFDAYGRPAAYHLLTRHPGSNTYEYGGKKYERVPADQIIHMYVKDRPTQSRGVPWMHSAMTRLNMLGAFEDAAVINARVGASKMGFFTRTDEAAEYAGDGDNGANMEMEAEPGTLTQLPPGVDFKEWNPQYPNSEFADFEKAMLRSISSGLNVSYTSLASDLEGVNYSSIRQGVLDERDHWRMLQGWMIEHLCNEVFADWLLMSLTTGALGKLPPSKYDKFNAPVWQPRGWGWVDPLKDVKAQVEAINAGLKTRASAVAEQGLDLMDVFEQLAEEDKLAEKFKLGLKNTQNLNDGGGKQI